MIVSMYEVSEGVLAWKSNLPINCPMVGNIVLKCYIVHNLNISLLFLVHLSCLWKILLYYGSSLFTFCLSFHVSPSHFWLTWPLEQQLVSCESTVCSMCYDVCIVHHDCIYTDYIVCVFSKLFICLPGNGCWSPLLKVKGVKFGDFCEDYPKY